MICKICNKDNLSCFSGIILNKYEVEYYQCSNCNFVQTEEPYWLDEAYSKSINVSDTGYIARNVFYSKKAAVLLYLLFGKKANFLDFAGGYGVFVRLMRDIGFNFYWDDKYTSNLFAEGFEYNKKIKIDAITVFECFEHFVDPIFEIEKILKISDTIIFSTNLYPDPLPIPSNWWYYGLNHGQHISFYHLKTFKFISKKYNLNYYNINNLHILTSKRVNRFKLLIVKFSNRGIYKIVKKILSSKTVEDYEFFTNK
jgi:hypothetical protein